jgi:hypothetical protein
MKREVLTSFLVLTLSLTACGGGSSNDDWVKSDPSARAISTSSFDIQAAWTALNSAPNSSQLTVSGSCSGTYILSNAASVQLSANVMFNNTTVSRSFLNCVPPYETMSSVDYRLTYNKFAVTNNQLQNYYSYVSDYSERFYWRQPFAKFPTTAKVGDTGLIGILDNYNYYGSKINVQEWAYTVEQDTAYSIIFNLVVKVYDTTTSTTNNDYSTAPISKTEQFRYLVSQANQMRLIKYDRIDADGFTIYGRLN